MAQTKEALLDRYTKAMEALQEDIADNATVFKNHENLVGAVIEAENDLRDVLADLAEAGDITGVNNGDYYASVTPQEQTVYDDELIKKTIPAAITTTKRPPRIVVGKVRS